MYPHSPLLKIKFLYIILVIYYISRYIGYIFILLRHQNNTEIHVSKSHIHYLSCLLQLHTQYNQLISSPKFILQRFSMQM